MEFNWRHSKQFSSSLTGAPSRNIVHLLQRSQTSGTTQHSVRSLPQEMLDRLSNEYNNIPKLISRLWRARNSNDLSEWRTIIPELGNLFAEEESNVDAVQNKENFVLFGGGELLVDAIWRDPLFPTINFNENTQTSLLNEIFCLLRELCCSVQSFGEWLCSIPELISFLLSIVHHTQVFDTLVNFLEEIIASKTDSLFDLSLIPDLSGCIQKLSSRQLACMCRLLALLIFEPNRYIQDEENKTEKQYMLLKRKKFGKGALSKEKEDRNQKILTAVPNLIERLMKLIDLQSFPYQKWSELLSRLSSSTPSATNGDAIELLLSNLEDVGEEDLENIDIEPDQLEEPPRPLSLKALTLASQQVEIFFVLCTLLSGICKNEVQEKLKKVNIVQTLSSFFDKVSWAPSHHLKFDRVHGPNCECNPESALKIQFLRLILNFCDRTPLEDRELLLSPQERRMLTSISLNAFPVRPPSSPASQKEIGLFTRIVDLLLTQNYDTNFRYWLCAVMESFLRGAGPAHQIFLYNYGVFDFLIAEILTESKNLQSYFDLLGELLKFNPQILLQFTELFSPSKFSKFFEIVLAHLVDSNVFLRSILVTLEHFRSENGEAKEKYPFSRCKVNQFLEQNRKHILLELFSTITLDELCQENVCCLNSALLFYSFGMENNALPTESEFLEARTKNGELPLIDNILQLLEFWKDYYHKGDRDAQNLEYCNKLSFSRFEQTVETLLTFCREAKKKI